MAKLLQCWDAGFWHVLDADWHDHVCVQILKVQYLLTDRVTESQQYLGSL